MHLHKRLYASDFQHRTYCFPTATIPANLCKISRIARILVDIPRYLQHIGFTGTPQADLQTLQQLHRCHMLAVPFENLSIIYHQSIDLSEGGLFSKIVEHNRGGFVMN